MNINNLKTIYDHLVILIDTDPVNAYPYVKSEVVKLAYEEKAVLFPFIKRHYNALYSKNKLPLENQMYLVEILNAINDDIRGYRHFATLTLKDITATQIAKLFYELKTCNYLSNTNEEIAAAISSIFNFNQDTILNYLENPTQRFTNQPTIFKNII